jgi:hypothetical protein
MPSSCTSRTSPPTRNRRPEGHDPDELKIMQNQAGHEHASTTALYTSVSSDYRVKTLRRALDSTVRDALAGMGD